MYLFAMPIGMVFCCLNICYSLRVLAPFLTPGAPFDMSDTARKLECMSLSYESRMSEQLSYWKFATLVGLAGTIFTLVVWVIVDTATTRSAILPMVRLFGVVVFTMMAVSSAITGYYETLPRRQEGLLAARRRKYARWLSRAYSGSVGAVVFAYILSRVDTIVAEPHEPVSGWSVATWLLVMASVVLYTVYRMTMGDVKSYLKAARVNEAG
jgi:hypothetical protein